MVSTASDISGTGPHLTASGPDQAGRPTDQDGPALAITADRSALTAQHGRPVRSWPLLVLAAPAAADRWTWLIITCHAQLRLARPLADDLRLP